MHTVNTLYTTSFPFRDLAGALVTGKVNGDFTKSAYLTSAGGTTATVTVAAVSGQSGNYSASFTPTAVGVWKLLVSCTHSGHTYRWEDEVEVVTAAQFDPSDPEAVAAAILEATVADAGSNTVGRALAHLLGGQVTTVPVEAGLDAADTLTLTIGHAYLDADDDALPFTNAGWTVHDLTAVGVVVWFAAIGPGAPIRVEMTVENATTVQLELTAAQTYRMRGSGSYKVYAQLPGQSDPVVLVQGALSMQGA